MAGGALFTAEELAWLRLNFATAGWEAIRFALPGRTDQAIRVKVSHMGLTRNKNARTNLDPQFRMEDGTVIGKLPESERWYLAGLLDGEGCFSLQGRWNERGYAWTVSAGVTFTNTDRRLIDFVNTRIPGKVYEKEPATRTRTCWYWRMFGQERIRTFCREIAPYLIGKREQAELIAAGWEAMDTDQRFALVDRVSQLKRL